MLAVRVEVSGRVQGVGYRAWLAAQAQRRGLWGWVRNRVDGSVEAVLAGAPEEIDAMIDACRAGPQHAAVIQVRVADAAHTPPPGLHLLPTA